MKCKQPKCEYEAEVKVMYSDGDVYEMCSLHAISAVSFGDCVAVGDIRKDKDIEIPPERLEILNYE